MAANYAQYVAEAVDLEEAGDLEGALARWYLTVGSFPVTSTSKDGLTVTFSDSDRREKIAQLERRLAKLAGSGKVRRIPIVKEPVSGPSGSVAYDADGYAWGY
jgi:hypothetical protein